MFSKQNQRKHFKRFVWLNGIVVILCLVYTVLDSSNIYSYTIRSSHYQTVLPYNRIISKRPVILLWTTFFGGLGWFTESKDIFNKTSRDCILTNNKSDLELADAVVFHLNDIKWYGSFLNGFGVPLPKVHKPNQIWVLYNLEPLPSILFDDTSWNGIFNWTMTFKLDSDVPVPYGEFAKLNQNEQELIKSSHAQTGYPFYGQHPENGGIAMISNCIDDARRYKIIDKLKKYVDIQVIGRCGDSTSDYKSRKKALHKYKFYLALENSDCKHYVSEKYWRAIERHQIPIVAWKNNMSGIVIPGSYINVFDFRDLDEAGEHIAEVNRNVTLYNSYFDWTLSYKCSYQNGWCKLCDALRIDITQKYYNDIHGWLHQDTCTPLTAMGILHRIFDRFMYDFRIY